MPASIVNFKLLLLASVALRLAFFFYGIYQDSHHTVRYTDIDYYVFHDAAQFVHQGQSPYLRDTYRYTPLLSWLMLLNHYSRWFHTSKLLFILFDILTGLIILRILRNTQVKYKKALLLTAIWLLNPMVITISTRGNCETVLCFLIMITLAALQAKHYLLSSVVFGLSIHFKIYPVIYSIPITVFILSQSTRNWKRRLFDLITFALGSFLTLIASTLWMYKLYGQEFLNEALLYHVVRIDHRHNFSIWNVLLYLTSSMPVSSSSSINFSLATFAFAPQFIVTICGSLILQWKPKTLRGSFNHLLNVLFIQTLAFVTYNKVCTSQYFIWYLIFLPFYLARTNLHTYKQGIPMILAWIATQAIWLTQAYRLEFLGENVFYKPLFLAAVSFFLANVYIIGECIEDSLSRDY